MDRDMLDLLAVLADEFIDKPGIQFRIGELIHRIELRNVDAGTYSAEELECMGADGLSLLAGADA